LLGSGQANSALKAQVFEKFDVFKISVRAVPE